MNQTQIIQGLEWLSERVPYREAGVTGDTFPITWGEDDILYTSAGDPQWGCCSDDWGMDAEKIIGDPPRDWLINRTAMLPEYVGWGAEGPKPTGMISVNGKLYLAVQNILGRKPPAHGTNSQHGSDAGILLSEFKGQFWHPHKQLPPVMFPGHLFGGPAFINYGKDNVGARDEYVYAVSSDQWDNGCDMRLGRVPKDQILDASAWEWVTALSGGNPRWSGDLTQSIPVLTLDRCLGAPEMVYLPAIERYLMLTWRLHGDFSPRAGTDLFLYESPEPWGPFTLVYQEDNWEGNFVNPYCPRVPLKWMEPDGVTGWMLFSGSWDSPHNTPNYKPYYRANVRKFRLTVGG